jgi:hypothetical protein
MPQAVVAQHENLRPPQAQPRCSTLRGEACYTSPAPSCFILA